MTGNHEKQEIHCESKIENLALERGLTIVVLKDENSAPVTKSNNNSICEILYSSKEFAPKCAEFCGKAFRDAVKADETISVECHANLHYKAVPIQLDETTQLVAIVGRVFLKSEEYKNAAKRAISGDFQIFSSEKLFENVLLASSDQEIDKSVKKLEKLFKKEKAIFLSATNSDENIEEYQKGKTLPETFKAEKELKLIKGFQQKPLSEIKKLTEENIEEPEESSDWRAILGSLMDLNYKTAYSTVLNFIASRYAVSNLAWLENIGNKLKPVLTIGEFSGHSIELGISVEDPRLLEAVEKELPIKFRERQPKTQGFEGKTINLFPVTIGGKVMSGLVIGDKLAEVKTKKSIARFMQNVSTKLEILRLREQIENQSRTKKAIQKLNESLKEIDGEEFWNTIAEIFAELMHAERSSLLLLNEESKELVVKAAVGSRADIIKREIVKDIGKRVSQKVLKSGKPLIVKNIIKEGFDPAPTEWKYKSSSFISYPIIIGGRNIGVLNVTDTVDGKTYDESDLELLETLSPQLAVAIDHTSLKLKTAELRQISITDSLTGLLNRRYLEERLTEEINRSQRHGYQMSFMMIDVDNFKSYNDSFSHPEGDKALQIVGQCLKATLRGADIAARYGGEEFSILLPQTGVNEAYTIAERLRQKVEATKFPNRQITISIGISNCSAELCDAEKLISAADKALYQAKRKGKNNVQFLRSNLL